MIKKHIPNTITCLNLISGCIATYWAFQGDYRVSSPIGKELDSLADDITFGFAPSAIIFSYLNESCAAANSTLCTLHSILPFVAFILAAFSALRLAKFNLDERQALGFIGLPTPANALFWGALIGGLQGYDIHFEGIEWCIIAGIFISSYLLISEIPMFALKFKTWGWKGNEIKYIFLLTCIPMLFLGIFGLAAIIAWYVILSAVNTYMLN